MQALKEIFSRMGKDFPESMDLCIYKSGLFDSMDIVQLVFEIERQTSRAIDFEEFFGRDISINRLCGILGQ